MAGPLHTVAIWECTACGMLRFQESTIKPPAFVHTCIGVSEDDGYPALNFLGTFTFKLN